MKTYPELMYDWARQRPEKVINFISPSMLGRCMRTHYLAINHVPQTTPPNPGAILNFQVGFLWEDVVKAALEAAKETYIEQVYMYDEKLNMGGTMDFARLDLEDLAWEVADSKTEGSKAAMYRKRMGKSFFNAHPEYAIQLCCYYIMMKRKGFKVKKQGKFIVIVKDNGLIEEEICQFTDELVQTTLDRINKLNKHLKEGTLPDCECEGWQVNYCSWGDPASIEKNKTGKMVPMRCCSDSLGDVINVKEKVSE